MRFSEVKIGSEFTFERRRWRKTDKDNARRLSDGVIQAFSANVEVEDAGD